MNGNTNLKSGDVVILKSGGPPMTIVHEAANGAWYCAWFVEGNSKVESFTFKADALTRANPKDYPGAA